MASDTFVGFDPRRVPSPCFVVDEAKLEENLQLLGRVQQASGARILLALKAFSMFALAPLAMRYLAGTAASGLYEARLGRHDFGGAVHVYAPALSTEEFDEVLELADYITFNSLSQWQRLGPRAMDAARRRPHLRFGLRVNPGCSQVETVKYDPSAPFSRLGMVAGMLRRDQMAGLTGLHFHNLCEQGFLPLARTLDALERQCGDILHQMEWANWGGGHLITDAKYDVSGLIDRLGDFMARYNVQVWLEPGAAVVLNAGVLVTEVLDLTWNGMEIALLDTSATTHLPDVLEMPYRPQVMAAQAPGVYPHLYRLGGRTCLAGDIIGDYSFKQPLKVGSRLVLGDMAHYTMVKTTTFNGIPLPSLAIWNSRTDDLRIVRSPSYEDFRNRLS